MTPDRQKRRPKLTRQELQDACEKYVDRQLALMQRCGALREPLSPERRQTVVQKVMAATVS